MGLTPKLAETAAAIRRLTQGDVPPTYDELAAELRIVKSQVHGRIQRLSERGVIVFKPGRARSIRFAERDVDLTSRSIPELRALRDRIERELRRRSW